MTASLDPIAMLPPRRAITGISAILLPFTSDGSVDWPASPLMSSAPRRRADPGGEHGHGLCQPARPGDEAPGAGTHPVGAGQWSLCGGGPSFSISRAAPSTWAGYLREIDLIVRHGARR